MENTALITGASSGIGKALAKLHGTKGGDILIVARRSEKLMPLKKSMESSQNTKVKIINKDLTQTNAYQEIYDELKQAGIEIDYLINNAGVGGQGKFHEREWPLDQSMIQLNILALTKLCRLFLPYFVALNSGRILNASSTASLMLAPPQAVYFDTKAYVTTFSNALSEELRESKATVTTLLPGATATEFMQVSGMDYTPLYKQKIFSPVQMGKANHKGVMKGQLDEYAGLTLIQKVIRNSLPFTPKKLVLSQIIKMQELSQN